MRKERLGSAVEILVLKEEADELLAPQGKLELSGGINLAPALPLMLKPRQGRPD